MNTGKTLFAQLMDFLPWTTFTRIVERHGGAIGKSIRQAPLTWRADAWAMNVF
jgi:Domain of unknown function (DUF4372)